MKKKILLVFMIIFIGSYEDEAKAINEHSYATDLIYSNDQYSPPRFVTELKDITTEEGTTVVMEAKVEGTEPIYIKIYKDGKEITSSKRIKITFEFGYISITIQRVIFEDAGTYTILAYNKLGEAKTSCTLKVK